MNSILSLVFAFATLGAPPEPTTVPDPKLAELVRQLGHPEFQAREAAAKELLKHGAKSVPALTAGTKDGDAEVAERCKLLLPVAAAAEMNVQLAQLQKDPAAPPPKGLAGVERFLKIAGDNKANRQLYAEMMTAHHKIIEAMEVDPKAGSRLVTTFCDDAYGSSKQRIVQGYSLNEFHFPVRDEITLFLFARGDSRFSEDNISINRTISLAHSKRLRADVNGPEAVPGIKNLYLAWLKAEKQPELVADLCYLADRMRLKEAAPTVLKYACDRSMTADTRAKIITYYVRIGGAEALKDLASALEDKTQIVPPLALGGKGQPLSLQLRDVALGVSVQLAGGKLEDYGFDPAYMWRENMPTIEPFFYARPDNETRDQAHAKWKDWVKANEKPSKK